MNRSDAENDACLYPIRPADLERVRHCGPAKRRSLRLIQKNTHGRELRRAQTHEPSAVVGERAP